VRTSIGPFSLASHPLMPGAWTEVPAEAIGSSRTAKS
jgi:23S rRNA pseudouridine2457 synthase